MPKFNKTQGFSLKSGNNPTFQQMGGGSPGKMYNAPLKAEDNEVKKDEEAPKVEDKKEPVKPRDSNAAMAGKFAFNMLMGGMTEAGMLKDDHSLAINFGPKKGEEAGEALTIEQKMLKKGYELGDLTKAKNDKEKKSEYSGLGYDPNYKNPFKK